MFAPDYLVNYINSAISKIKYPDEPSGLYEPIKYTLCDGGKRLRPLLTLATCDALGGDIDGAKKSSEKAALWVILAFTLGLATLPIQMALSLL